MPRLINPSSGAVVDVSDEQAAIMLDQGFRPETSVEELSRLEAEGEQERYDTLSNEAASLVSGAFSGASLGLSDLVFGDEQIQKAREYNPIAGTVGEIVGSVGPALASGGTSLLSKTPAGMAARLADDVAARGAGKGLLSDVMYKSAGFGAEGALFSAGQYVSDVALERKDLSAEAFVGEVGSGALFGGALGAAFAASSKVAGSLGRASESIKAGVPVKTVSASKIIPKKARTSKARARQQAKLAEEARTQISNGEALVSRAERVFDDVRIDNFKQVSARAEDAAAAGRQADHVADLQAKAQRLRESRDTAMAWVDDIGRRNPTDGVGSTTASKLEPGELRGHARAKGKKSGGDVGYDMTKTYQRRDELPRKLFSDDFAALGVQKADDKIAASMPKPAAAVKQADEFDPITGELVDDIFDVAAYEKAQHELATDLIKISDPEDAVRFAEFNAPYEKALKREAGMDAKRVGSGAFEKASKAGEFYEVMQVLGVPLPQVESLPVVGPLLGAYLKARLGMRALGKTKLLENPTSMFGQKAASLQNRITDSVGRFAKPAKRAAGVAKSAAVPSVSAILSSPLFEQAEAESTAKAGAAQAKADLYRARLDELTRAKTQPDRVQEIVAQSIQVADPELEEQASAVIKRRLDFLFDKAPKDPRTPNPMGLKARPWSPTESDLATFAKYVRAAEDPSTVIDDFENGRLSFEAAETLRNVYPALYADVQEELMDAVADSPDDVPYSKRVQMSILFDVPVESTMSSHFLLATSEHHQARQAEDEPQPSINPQAAVSLGEDAMYSTARRASR